MKLLLRWSDHLSFLVIFILVAIYAPQTWPWYAGLGLAAVSFPLALLARFQLGRSFSITAQARQLVTTGLYRWFRHPIYLFGMLSFLGVFIALQHWWLLALWLPYCMLVQGMRLKREEAVLEEAFGEAYLAHRARTWI